MWLLTCYGSNSYFWNLLDYLCEWLTFNTYVQDGRDEVVKGLVFHLGRAAVTVPRTFCKVPDVQIATGEPTMSSTCLAARQPREISQIWHLNTCFAILEWSPYIKFCLLSIPRITWNHFCKSGMLRFIWQRVALYVCNILILSYCIAIQIVMSWILPAHIYGNDPLRLHFPSHNWQMAETDRSLLPSSSTSLIRGHT